MSIYLQGAIRISDSLRNKTFLPSDKWSCILAFAFDVVVLMHTKGIEGPCTKSIDCSTEINSSRCGDKNWCCSTFLIDINCTELSKLAVSTEKSTSHVSLLNENQPSMSDDLLILMIAVMCHKRMAIAQRTSSRGERKKRRCCCC